MNNLLSKEFAQALYESGLPLEDQKKWAVFSGFMSEDHIQSVIRILNTNTAELEKELQQIAKKLESIDRNTAA